MRQLFKTVLILLTIAVFACGCKKEDTEEPTVTSHDFTVEQWAEFIDQKEAAQAEAAKRAAEEAANGDTGTNGTYGSEPSQNSSSSDNPADSGSSLTDPTPTPAPVTVIVIDPGHGGGYTGATYNKVVEKDLTLKTAKFARDYLEDNYENVEVYLTREEDKALADNLVDDLEKRAKIAKEHKANALVSIHFNASENHNRTGTYIYVSRRSQVKDECKGLARAIMKELTELGTKERAIEERKSNDMFDDSGDAYDYYAINRHCAARNIPGIIVEQCFMDNEEDRQFIESDMALKMLGEANARGIAEYYGLTRKAE